MNGFGVIVQLESFPTQHIGLLSGTRYSLYSAPIPFVMKRDLQYNAHDGRPFSLVTHQEIDSDVNDLTWANCCRND